MADRILVDLGDQPRFLLDGANAQGRPKWLHFPCQMQGAESDDRCQISINGQRNGQGATWTVDGAEKAGAIAAPNVNPSIKCGDRCHFHIRHGRFDYCGDHKGRRDG